MNLESQKKYQKSVISIIKKNFYKNLEDRGEPSRRLGSTRWSFLEIQWYSIFKLFDKRFIHQNPNLKRKNQTIISRPKSEPSEPKPPECRKHSRKKPKNLNRRTQTTISTKKQVIGLWQLNGEKHNLQNQVTTKRTKIQSPDKLQHPNQKPQSPEQKYNLQNKATTTKSKPTPRPKPQSPDQKIELPNQKHNHRTKTTISRPKNQTPRLNAQPPDQT